MTAIGTISKPQLICGVCLQPILDGQLNHEPPFSPDGIFVHSLASDCVAATEAATARRCAAAMCKHCAAGSQIFDRNGIPVHDLRHMEGFTYYNDCKATAIRREFPAAFVRVEEVG